MSNVVEVVGADKYLATMASSVEAAGLDVLLSQKGPFTLFAPTDMAFSKLEPGRMARLMKEENLEKLIELLVHHVVEGITNYNDFKDNQLLVTANGRGLKVKIADGRVTINGATIHFRENIATNGVVYLLDTVIEMI
jgi:uncharacterized surface protein with fasciclin (FAS1) repeats